MSHHHNSNNHGNISVKIIQMPIETDEHGNPKNLDFASIAKHLTDVTPQIKTETPTTTLGEIPTPRQIFEQASHSVLYQPNALRELSTVFFYHLCNQKQRHTTAQNKQNNYDKAYLDKVGKALGFNEEFFAYLETLKQEDIDNLVNLQKNDPKAAEQYINELKTQTPQKTAHSHGHQAPIFLTGKTGSGKTHMIKELCKMFDVNFIAVNAASISNAGYKGVTLADIGTSLLQSANNDNIKAEHSVVFFDEFDKLFINGGEQIGAYHLSLVTEILTIIEGTTPFPVKDDHGINSSQMLFILGGSFNIHQKKERTPIGFTNKKQLQDIPDSQVKLADFGLPDELAGRIGKIIGLEEISDSQMVEILLKSPSSPFVTFQKQLALVNCTAEISKEVLEKLAKDHKDAMDKFGVRGLYQAFHGLSQITRVLHEAPEQPYSHYVITAKSYVRIKNSPPPTPTLVKSNDEHTTHQTPDVEYDDIPF